MQIKDSTILVTGGSSGLGAACVQSLLRQDARVIIADLQAPAEDVMKAAGDRMYFAETNTTDESSLRETLDAGQNCCGPLRGLVACAGILHAERVVKQDGVGSLESFAKVIDVNLTGVYRTVALTAKAISRQSPLDDGERGVLVLASSVAAFDGQIGQAAYAASKGGVASMTLPLSRDLSRHGIRVVSIAPGVFETPMMQAAPDKVRKSLMEQTPFPHRFGEPAEFAALVSHVFENCMLNGCTLRLDGGLRMAAK